MKLTEFIKKLQGFKKQIEANTSHPPQLWDKIEFAVENTERGYDTGDYEILDNKIADYCIDLLPGCHCQSTLTLVFSKLKKQEKSEARILKKLADVLAVEFKINKNVYNLIMKYFDEITTFYGMSDFSYMINSELEKYYMQKE